MKLIILGSSSSGNGYILQTSEGESLLIEAGLPMREVKKALDFDISKVAGAIISHRHGDHFKYAADYLKAGIETYMEEVNFPFLPLGHHRLNGLEHGKTQQIGSFKVSPFNVLHDVPCFGFLLHHPEMGKTVFITDTHYSRYTFNGLNNVIVEANYCEEIMMERFMAGSLNAMVRDRIYKSHMSLATAKGFLEANDLSQVRNIVLIHLSDGNSDEVRFKKEVQELTGKKVFVASKGMEVPLGIPF